MKFVIDNAIPFIKGVFEPYADVSYIDGEDITRTDIRDADALVIRTRTRCDARMLRGSRVKMIATTTIGVNNIDMDYCTRHGIHVQNASGTVSGAVMNYVFSALYGAASRKSISLTGAVFGILGVGNVGGRVEQSARMLGFKVLRYDPWRARTEGPEDFCDLDSLLAQSDIVTMHLPVNDATRGMADADFFAQMKPGAFFINPAKGELVDEAALIDAAPKLGPVVIDAWCNEPDINRELMEVADIATPHVSGYSYQGKLLATRSAVRSVARFYGLSELYDFFPVGDVAVRDAVRLDLRGKSQGEIASVFQYNYPIFTDDFMFRMNPDSFNELRVKYRYRREFFIE